MLRLEWMRRQANNWKLNWRQRDWKWNTYPLVCCSLTSDVAARSRIAAQSRIAARSRVAALSRIAARLRVAAFSSCRVAELPKLPSCRSCRVAELPQLPSCRSRRVAELPSRRAVAGCRVAEVVELPSCRSCRVAARWVYEKTSQQLETELKTKRLKMKQKILLYCCSYISNHNLIFNLSSNN